MSTKLAFYLLQALQNYSFVVAMIESHGPFRKCSVLVFEKPRGFNSHLVKKTGFINNGMGQLVFGGNLVHINS